MRKKMVGSGMKSPTMPKEKFERSYPTLDGVDMKYASEMNAAEEYHAANQGLKNYVRSHAMKNS
jgi:hypothetical protein